MRHPYSRTLHVLLFTKWVLSRVQIGMTCCDITSFSEALICVCNSRVLAAAKEGVVPSCTVLGR